MQRTSHAIIITGAMIVFFMHKRLNLMAILDNWLMPPFILMTLRTVPRLTQSPPNPEYKRHADQNAAPSDLPYDRSSYRQGYNP